MGSTSLAIGIDTQVTVQLSPVHGRVALLRSDYIIIQLKRFCGAQDHVRLFIPILSAFILVDRPLLAPERVMVLYMLIYPFALILNTLRLTTVIGYTRLRFGGGVPGASLTTGDFHLAIGGYPYIAFGGVLLYLLYRAVRRGA